MATKTVFVTPTLSIAVASSSDAASMPSASVPRASSPAEWAGDAQSGDAGTSTAEAGRVVRTAPQLTVQTVAPLETMPVVEEPTTPAYYTPEAGDAEYPGPPGGVNPQWAEKEILSCGDPELMETGTTCSTDGTSGWAQMCASQMMAARG